MTVKEIFSAYFLVTLGTFEFESSSPGFILHTMVVLQMTFQPGTSLHQNGSLQLSGQVRTGDCIFKNP